MVPDDTDTNYYAMGNEPAPRGPYDGLNRAQRRKAMAVEKRAFRKEAKEGRFHVRGK